MLRLLYRTPRNPCIYETGRKHFSFQLLGERSSPYSSSHFFFALFKDGSSISCFMRWLTKQSSPQNSRLHMIQLRSGLAHNLKPWHPSIHQSILDLLLLSLTVMVGTVFCVVPLTTTMAKVAAVHKSWDRIQTIVVRFQVSVLILVH